MLFRSASDSNTFSLNAKFCKYHSSFSCLRKYAFSASLHRFKKLCMWKLFFRSVFLKSGFWESSRRAVSPYCPENMYPIGKVLSGFFPAFPEYSCESLYAIFILTFLLQLCQRNKDFLTAPEGIRFHAAGFFRGKMLK